MYQVGTYKNNSWALVSEFAKSGVIFDFDASSAQAEAAKNWKNMYRITTSKECPERPTQTEKLCTEIWKKECIFLSRHKKTQISNALKLHYNTNKDRTLVNSSSIS